MSYDDLVHAADNTGFEGWDFSVLEDRMIETEPSWNYRQEVTRSIPRARSMLDMGTGGGEFLAGLDEHPARVIATEGYPPNIPVAQRRLAPLNVTVIPIPETEGAALPLADNAFDLIINRHEYYDPGEIRRILAPGGVFITQQVGGDDLTQLNQALDAPGPDFHDWNLDTARDQLTRAGLEILDGRHEYCHGEFRDIGAVVLYLRIVPWQIPGYRRTDYDARLRALHDRITAQGPLVVRHHRFLVTARG